MKLKARKANEGGLLQLFEYVLTKRESTTACEGNRNTA